MIGRYVLFAGRGSVDDELAVRGDLRCVILFVFRQKKTNEM